MYHMSLHGAATKVEKNLVVSAEHVSTEKKAFEENGVKDPLLKVSK